MRKQTSARQCIDLPLHAFFLIEVPPARSKLHLAHRFSILEITNHRRDEIVVRRIEVVNDRLGQTTILIQTIQKLTKRSSLRRIAKRVAAEITTDCVEESRVVVSPHSGVKLIGPVFLMIQFGQLDQHKSRELGMLERIRRDAFSGRIKDVTGY